MGLSLVIHFGAWPTVILVTLFTLFSYVIHAGYQHRSRFNRLRKMGLPMPEWSWVFGHLLILQKYVARYPPNTFVPIPLMDIGNEFPDTDLFYLDLWPFAPAFLCVTDPDVATKATAGHTFPKSKFYKPILDSIMGGSSLLTMNGQEWKEWRTLFNPAFNPGYLLEQVPAVVDSVKIFCDQLQKRADTVFPLEDIATRLTMDIIIKVVLDDDLNYQLAPNPLADSLRSIISWSSFGNPLTPYHPMRPFMIRYYGNIMNKYIHKILEERFQELNHERIHGVSMRSKSVISLTFASYMADTNAESKNTKLDDTFAKQVTSQIRLFLFAGHNTTTSVLVYTYHMLSRHPEILRKMRKEHSAVFGENPNDVEARLKENPPLLNRLTYTLAVIKETMRLYPPAGASREGASGASLTDRHGTQYPADDVHVSFLHTSIHRNPRVWVRAEEFLPERWLVGPEDELHAPSGALRTFEQGPRSCIGQNLSLIELRVTLAMTVRTFMITPAYEEWDAMQKPGFIRGLFNQVGLWEKTPMSIAGERAYPIEKGGAHPADEYPCRVALVENYTEQ